MDVAISKESFGQSAKILNALIDERFGKQGRGALAQSREMLARALKFESAHALDGFFARMAPAAQAPAPVPAATPDSRRFDDLPLDERAHALGQILQSIATDVGMSMWEERARGLVSLLVEIEGSEFGAWMKGDSFLDRLRYGLNFEPLARSRHGMAEHSKPSRMLDAYLASLPGYELRAAKQSDTTRDQHGYLAMQVAKVLDMAERLESRGAVLLVSANAMMLVAKEGYFQCFHTCFDGHWLSERRFGIVASKIANRRTALALPQEPLDAWDFMLSALAMPIEDSRSAAMNCLLDIIQLPASHISSTYEELQATMDAIVEEARLASVRAAEQAAIDKRDAHGQRG